MTVMESYFEVADRKRLHTLLRRDMGFLGVSVTDFEEIRNLVAEAVKLALVEYGSVRGGGMAGGRR